MSSEIAPLTSEVKVTMDAIIENFNNGLPKKCAYIPRYSDRYLYLARTDYGSALLPICRLEWRGRQDNWDFAIYKHSHNKYAPESGPALACNMSMVPWRGRCSVDWRHSEQFFSVLRQFLWLRT